MSEPTTNARRERSSRRMFYNFTRRYGEQIVLQKVDTNAVDYQTGARTRTYTSTTIRNSVYVPPHSQRNVVFTPAMMQAIRQYAWQGGAGQDIEETQFLVFEDDIRDWGEIDASQNVVHRGKQYEVTGHQRFDGGVVIAAKIATGAHE